MKTTLVGVGREGKGRGGEGPLKNVKITFQEFCPRM